jgi:hypothetical protein
VSTYACAFVAECMAAQHTTNFRGRRCTKVLRRAVTENAHTSTANAKGAPEETASPSKHEKETTSPKKSVYAPTTATPHQSAQVAVPHQPNHSQATAAAAEPARAPSPEPAPAPQPEPAPSAAVSASENPETHPAPIVISPVAEATPIGSSSQVRSFTFATASTVAWSSISYPSLSSSIGIDLPAESSTDPITFPYEEPSSSLIRFLPISTDIVVDPAITSQASLTSTAQNTPVAAPVVNPPSSSSGSGNGSNGGGVVGGSGGGGNGAVSNSASQAGSNQLSPAAGSQSPVSSGQPALFTSSGNNIINPQPQMANTPVPVLITISSKGQSIVRTSFSTPSPTAPIGGKNGNGASPQGTGTGSPTNSGAIPTIQGLTGNTPSTPHKSAGNGIIAGVVSGVMAIVVITGLLFFCARKRKQSWKEKEGEDNYSAPFFKKRHSSMLSSKFTGFFGRKKTNSMASDPSGRSNTPSLERGFGRSSMAEVPNPSRIRSSSEPASRALNFSQPRIPNAAQVGGVAAVGAAVVAGSQFARKDPGGQPRLPEFAFQPGESHRRSVSSVTGMAYPVLSETNNPFLDPDPNAPLRIINPDSSRIGTPATTPRKGGLNTPTTPATVGLALSSPPRPNLRPRSTLQNPFADPVPRSVPIASKDPFADPAPEEPLVPVLSPLRDSTNSESQYSPQMLSQRTSRHSRSRTYANVPLITQTAPSVASSYHTPQLSDDSGFVSILGTPATSSPPIGTGKSPMARSSARFGLGLGIERSPSNASASSHDQSLMPLPLRPIPASPRTPPPGAQDPSRLGIPRSVSAARPQQHRHHRSSNAARDLLSPASTTVSSTHRPLSTHSSGSSSSLSSSNLSLSFPSSWGEPGPTRPASQALEPGQAGARSLSSAAPSRVSDPFDLDVPELLAYASSESLYPPGAGNEVRRGSNSDSARRR